MMNFPRAIAKSLLIGLLAAVAFLILDVCVEYYFRRAQETLTFVTMFTDDSHEMFMRASGFIAFFLLGTFFPVLLDKLKNEKQLTTDLNAKIDELRASAASNALLEERFRLAFHTSPDAININAMDGTYVEINEGFTHITGYTREDAIGKSSLELNIWAEPQDRARLVEGLTRDGCVNNLEARFRYKDGRVAYGLMSARVISLNSGPHILSISRDINDRKLAEQELALSEHRLRTAFETTADTIIITRMRDSVITDVNRGFLITSGYAKEDVIGKTELDINVWQNPSHRQSFFDGLRQHGSVSNLETSFRGKNGLAKTGLISGSIITLNDEPHILIFVRDITDRKLAEEALTESRERVNLILQRMPVGCIVFDRDFRVELWNPHAEEIFGYTSAEAVGRRGYELIVDRGLFPVVDELWARLSSEGEAAHSVNENRTKDGSVITCEWYNSPMVRDGAIIGVIAMVQDITQRKLGQDRIAASLKEKEVLLKEIHHRVRNNLAVISSLLSMQARMIDDNKYVDIFKDCQGRIRSMALVHEKLYQSDQLSAINVRGYIEALGKSIRSSFTGERIELVIDAEPIELDMDTLIPCGLIINELLTNAFKHAMAGQDSPRCTVTLRGLDEDRIELAIADNGAGLPEGFELSKSNGLGLRLVSSLVEQLLGALELKGAGGVSFKLIFPRRGIASMRNP